MSKSIENCAAKDDRTNDIVFVGSKNDCIIYMDDSFHSTGQEWKHLWLCYNIK